MNRKNYEKLAYVYGIDIDDYDDEQPSDIIAFGAVEDTDEDNYDDIQPSDVD